TGPGGAPLSRRPAARRRGGRRRHAGNLRARPPAHVQPARAGQAAGLAVRDRADGLHGAPSPQAPGRSAAGRRRAGPGRRCAHPRSGAARPRGRSGARPGPGRPFRAASRRVAHAPRSRARLRRDRRGPGLEPAESEERDPPRAVAVARPALGIPGGLDVSRHLEAEELESLALGAQPGEPALMHLAECESCARELAWARAERNLLARRPAPAVDHLWTEVARRIAISPEQGRPLERRRRTPHWAWR